MTTADTDRMLVESAMPRFDSVTMMRVLTAKRGGRQARR
jgi:hypothetical protein